MSSNEWGGRIESISSEWQCGIESSCVGDLCGCVSHPGVSAVEGHEDEVDLEGGFGKAQEGGARGIECGY